MNVTVEPLPNCLATLRVDVPPDAVTAARENITKDYARHAQLPGYRPGKAPRAVVERKFQKQIKEELERKLLGDSTRAAISEKKLRVLQVQDVQDVEFAEDQSLHFVATVVTAPDFDLPDYKSIPVTLPSAEVTDADIDAALENLRNQAATFDDIEGRALEMEDFAVIDYAGTIDGKPVSEIYPKAGKPLTSNEGFWLRLTPEAFFPGFAQGLVGAKLEEIRELDIDVPADFAVAEMAGQKIHYVVSVRGLKSKKLPELDDAFAATIIEGKTMAELREVAKDELGRQKAEQVGTEKRDQIIKYLLAKVECELPEQMVRSETRRILADIVRENQTRGIADELLKESEKELVGAASEGARNRLKGTFVLLRIAEEEKITVKQEEIRRQVAALAARSGMTFEKMAKELENRNAMDRIAEDILTAKTLDFLADAANVQAAPAAG